MEAFVARYPDKFRPDERIFANISRGNREELLIAVAAHE